MKYDLCCDGTLEGFFALLDRLWAGPEGVRRVCRGAPPGSPRAGGEARGELFDEGPGGPNTGAGGGTGGPGRDRGASPGLPALLPDPAALEGAAGILYQVSADAYDVLVYTWMSEFPLEARGLRYGLGVLSEAKGAVRDAGTRPGAGGPWYLREEARKAAARAARNRHNGDCEALLAVSYKVAHEIDRLRGFLRFSPDLQGRYVARCAPDHAVLPALAPHFTRRFGAGPWAVIDERRGWTLAGARGACRMTAAGDAARQGEGRRGADPWEGLWRDYHRTVNIESRNNPLLQRRFVPLRYRDYLAEFDRPPDPPPKACN
jgi:hypothetical protein